MAPPMHPVVKTLLRQAHAIGVKAVSRALDSAFEDVDAGAKEVSRRVTKARGKLRDIEAKTRQRDDDNPDDSEEPQHG